MEEGLSRPFPIFISPDRFLRSRAELHLIFKTKDLHDIANEVNDGTNLIVQLVRATEDMSIILGEAPDTKQAMQLTRFFMPVYSAQLKVTEGKVPITSNL